jgi:hypothetical protein
MAFLDGSNWHLRFQGLSVSATCRVNRYRPAFIDVNSYTGASGTTAFHHMSKIWAAEPTVSHRPIHHARTKQGRFQFR